MKNGAEILGGKGKIWGNLRKKREKKKNWFWGFWCRSAARRHFVPPRPPSLPAGHAPSVRLLGNAASANGGAGSAGGSADWLPGARWAWPGGCRVPTAAGGRLHGNGAARLAVAMATAARRLSPWQRGLAAPRQQAPPTHSPAHSKPRPSRLIDTSGTGPVADLLCNHRERTGSAAEPRPLRRKSRPYARGAAPEVPVSSSWARTGSPASSPACAGSPGRRFLRPPEVPPHRASSRKSRPFLPPAAGSPRVPDRKSNPRRDVTSRRVRGARLPSRGRAHSQSGGAGLQAPPPRARASTPGEAPPLG